MFQGSRTEDIDVSLFQSQDALQCSRHAPLIRGFREYCESNPDETRLEKDMGFCKGSSLGEVTMTESVSSLGLYWNLLLVNEGNGVEDFAKGDIMDSDWVDVNKIKRWKTECLTSHGYQCENPMKIWTTKPAWLVDVELECIVPGTSESTFVALSYTYGNHLGLSVDVELSARLQQPYAFRAPDISELLPPLFRHAMFLTKALGERYLWADALCIVHGDSAELTRQLNMMSSIYASAVLTIIAADGDANDGIVGLEGASNPRALDQRIIQFGERKIAVRDSHYFSLVGGPQPYFSRAWTFQEHKIAKRKLFFLGRQAHWECQHQQFHEELASGAEVDTYIEPRLVESLAGFPVLSSIGNIICSYNECNLRYPEDALPGIIGLLSVMSRSFDGGFLYGIPEMFFDRALAWRPYWPHTEIQRRIQSDRPELARLPHSHLPSWSWIGWKGMVDLGHEASRINDGESSIEETYPITDWYTAISPTAEPSERRRIHSKWYENREAWRKTKMQLPGWTRVEFKSDEGTFRGEPRIFPAGCEGFVYRHLDMPKVKDWGPTDDWYFPFPVQHISGETMASMPEQTPYLFSLTQRARVQGRKTSNETNVITLCDRSKGHAIGKLHLHSRDQLQLFPDVQEASSVTDEHAHALETPISTLGKELSDMSLAATTGNDAFEIEVIAISLTRFYSKTWNEEASRYERPIRRTEKYNVLWIEWKDGIAYRKAGGVVQKEQWEQLELEDVHVVLG